MEQDRHAAIVDLPEFGTTLLPFFTPEAQVIHQLQQLTQVSQYSNYRCMHMYLHWVMGP